MSEFIILIFELFIIAGIQLFTVAALEEFNIRRIIPVINIAGMLISYFLLLRYVYNYLIAEFASLLNF